MLSLTIVVSTYHYPWIRAWGRMLQSDLPMIERAIQQARIDGAPTNATYRDHWDHWHTTDEVTHPMTRYLLGLTTEQPVLVIDLEEQSA